MSNNGSLEERVAALETELAEINRRLDARGAADWLARVAGRFENEPDCDEVFRLGREIRRADPPAPFA